MPLNTGMVTSPHPAQGHILTGTPVVPGLAYGPVFQIVHEVSEAAVASFGDGGFTSPDGALAAYDAAVDAVATGLADKAGRVSGVAAEVLVASAGLTRDKALRQAVETRLRDGEPLLDAVRGAAQHFADLFTSMGGLMAERATDLLDIERRLVARLLGEPEPGVALPEVPSILVAVDLAPADTAGLDPSVVLGIATEKGGATSHTAIIARQLGLPCVVGCAGLLNLSVGTPVLLDGGAGTVDPSVKAEQAAERIAADRAVRARTDRWTGPARTTDDRRVSLLANVADGASARAAAQAPVEGVGLFRTELCFLDRREEPTVQEQVGIYAEVLAPFAGGNRHVVVRTLDAGSDKPIAFANLSAEENPALGVRGLRLSRSNPGLLSRQLDSIAEAAESSGTDTWVMAPMVATVAEAEEFAAAARGRGLTAGIMVEVPSAVLLVERMLERVDFLSIGTNDLTQYVMAADRLSSDLADLTDPWQPAVLQMVARTADAGASAGKPVGVCGEAAADPLLALALVGMGVRSLSMATAAVRRVGAQISQVSMQTCRRAADAALQAADPQAGRAAVRRLIND